MHCRTSTALRTITGLLLEFFLRGAMGIGPPIQDGRSYICASRSAGLNLWLAMIQEDYGVTALVGQELLSPGFEQT
jgi:hypothetical protein